jgi:hypothetical protein
MVYHWFQVALETAALNQTGAQMQAVVAAKDLEIKGAIGNVSRQCSRQLVNNGDGLIAQCTTGGASTTINLLPQASGGLGYDAIVSGWLYPGLPVDIGTTADSDSLATGSVITDVSEDATAPTITIGSSVTTTSSHYVSIANPNSATATNPELNGFRNMFGVQRHPRRHQPRFGGRVVLEAGPGRHHVDDVLAGHGARRCRKARSRRPASTAAPSRTPRRGRTRTSTACCRTRFASPVSRASAPAASGPVGPVVERDGHQRCARHR